MNQEVDNQLGGYLPYKTSIDEELKLLSDRARKYIKELEEFRFMYESVSK